jgi:hypothetical protein
MGWNNHVQGTFITFNNLPSGMLIFNKKKITKLGTKHLNKGNVQPHIQSLNPLVMPYGKQDPTL